MHISTQAASVRVRLVHGVAYGSVHGVITKSTLGDVFLSTQDQLGGASPLIHLSDFRAAVWALTAQEMLSFFVGAEPFAIAPAALIVCPVSLPLMREHAWQAAELGILRKVFLCPVAAQDWTMQELARLRLQIAQ